MSSKGRTKLKICLSRAKDVKEAAGDVRFGVSPQKTGKNAKKLIFSSKFSENFRTCPNASERIQMHPNASERMRTGPNNSENLKQLAKTSKKSCKFQKTFRANCCEN